MRGQQIYQFRDAQATIEAARSRYVQQRIASMMRDPVQMARILSECYCSHPTSTGATLINVVTERACALPSLIELLEKAAETLALQDWADHAAHPVRVAA